MFTEMTTYDINLGIIYLHFNYFVNEKHNLVYILHYFLIKD